jgi:heme-degrading monooxygenase HmoA
MTTIQKSQDVLTLINVFTVAPEKQQNLVDLLIGVTEQTMRHLPGFISANIHKSYDGHRVVNYAQWRSREDFEAMLKSPEAAPHMAQAVELAEPDPILCEVVHLDHA